MLAKAGVVDLIGLVMDDEVRDAYKEADLGGHE
jgi:hypothetical protein